MNFLRNLLFAYICFMPVFSLAAPLVNINTADSEVLVDELVGVGPQKAMAIVRYRQQNGPFSQVDDLAQVDGIGIKTVDLNRARITVEQPKPKQPQPKQP